MIANNDIGFLVKRIHDRIETKFNQRLVHWDITLSQGRILLFLHERRGETTSQKDIEKHLEVSHPTTVGMLRRMENKRMITTRFDGVDKRAKKIYPTPRGTAIYRILTRFPKEMERNLLWGMTAGEKDELRRLLDLVHRNIQG